MQESENPQLQRFADFGADWIARDVLLHILNKAAALEGKLTRLPGTELETFVVPSSSNIKKPHVVVFMANGKCECQDCPGYSSLSLCAHAVAVSLKLQRLETYLKWLVTKHRKTGGVSYVCILVMVCLEVEGGSQTKRPESEEEDENILLPTTLQRSQG